VAQTFECNKIFKIALIRYFELCVSFPSFAQLSELILFICTVGGTRWRSSSGTALQTGRSRDRFPKVSLDFSLTSSFRSHYGLGVDSASNRNEYQEHFMGVKAAGVYG
jgi:hypothetical protein